MRERRPQPSAAAAVRKISAAASLSRTAAACLQGPHRRQPHSAGRKGRRLARRNPRRRLRRCGCGRCPGTGSQIGDLAGPASAAVGGGRRCRPGVLAAGAVGRCGPPARADSRREPARVKATQDGCEGPAGQWPWPEYRMRYFLGASVSCPRKQGEPGTIPSTFHFLVPPPPRLFLPTPLPCPLLFISLTPGPPIPSLAR